MKRFARTGILIAACAAVLLLGACGEPQGRGYSYSADPNVFIEAPDARSPRKAYHKHGRER